MMNVFKVILFLIVSQVGIAAANEYLQLAVKEPHLAEKHYKKACESGSSYGCVKVAHIFMKKGNRDYHTYAEKACRMKSAEGCGIDGTWFYNNGSKLRAVELWDIACKTGFSDYCVAIAAYKKDDKLDSEGFIEYMHLACVTSGARLDTCAFMGNHHIEVLKDLEGGKKYLSRACNHEYQKACDYLKKLEQSDKSKTKEKKK